MPTRRCSGGSAKPGAPTISFASLTVPAVPDPATGQVQLLVTGVDYLVTVAERRFATLPLNPSATPAPASFGRLLAPSDSDFDATHTVPFSVTP